MSTINKTYTAQFKASAAQFKASADQFKASAATFKGIIIKIMKKKFSSR